jgi:hypothetical protein
MGGTQLQEATTVPQTRIKASSGLTFLCAGCVLFLLCLTTFTRPVKTPPTFPLFWASGAAASRGANPYLAYPETYASHMTISGQVRPVAEINLNPPCVLPLFQLLARLPIEQFAHVWAVGSFLLLLATVALVMWNRPNLQHRQIVWLLLSAPVLLTLMGCQMYFLLFFLCTVALIFVESGHEIPAAVAIGIVVAFKPTMAYWPLFLFLSGFKRIATWACVVALAVGLGPLAFYGPEVYREWLQAVAIDKHWMFPTDIAIPAYFARLGLSTFGIALAVATAAFLSWTVYKTKPGFITVSGLALCAAVLCAPLSWADYALFVTPFFVSHRWRLPSNIAAALLMIPNPVPTYLSRPPGRLGIALGSGIYFAAFWIMVFVFWKSATHTLSPNRASETPDRSSEGPVANI